MIPDTIDTSSPEEDNDNDDDSYLALTDDEESRLLARAARPASQVEREQGHGQVQALQSRRRPRAPHGMAAFNARGSVSTVNSARSGATRVQGNLSRSAPIQRRHSLESSPATVALGGAPGASSTNGGGGGGAPRRPPRGDDRLENDDRAAPEQPRGLVIDILSQQHSMRSHHMQAMAASTSSSSRADASGGRRRAATERKVASQPNRSALAGIMRQIEDEYGDDYLSDLDDQDNADNKVRIREQGGGNNSQSGTVTGIASVGHSSSTAPSVAGSSVSTLHDPSHPPEHQQQHAFPGLGHFYAHQSSYSSRGSGATMRTYGSRSIRHRGGGSLSGRLEGHATAAMDISDGERQMTDLEATLSAIHQQAGLGQRMVVGVGVEIDECSVGSYRSQSSFRSTSSRSSMVSRGSRMSEGSLSGRKRTSVEAADDFCDDSSTINTVEDGQKPAVALNRPPMITIEGRQKKRRGSGNSFTNARASAEAAGIPTSSLPQAVPRDQSSSLGFDEDTMRRVLGHRHEGKDHRKEEYQPRFLERMQLSDFGSKPSKADATFGTSAAAHDQEIMGYPANLPFEASRTVQSKSRSVSSGDLERKQAHIALGVSDRTISDTFAPGSGSAKEFRREASRQLKSQHDHSSGRELPRSLSFGSAMELLQLQKEKYRAQLPNTPGLATQQPSPRGSRKIRRVKSLPDSIAILRALSDPAVPPFAMSRSDQYIAKAALSDANKKMPASSASHMARSLRRPGLQFALANRGVLDETTDQSKALSVPSSVTVPGPAIPSPDHTGRPRAPPDSVGEAHQLSSNPRMSGSHIASATRLTSNATLFSDPVHLSQRQQLQITGHTDPRSSGNNFGSQARHVAAVSIPGFDTETNFPSPEQQLILSALNQVASAPNRLRQEPNSTNRPHQNAATGTDMLDRSLSFQQAVAMAQNAVPGNSLLGGGHLSEGVIQQNRSSTHGHVHWPHDEPLDEGSNLDEDTSSAHSFDGKTTNVFACEAQTEEEQSASRAIHQAADTDSPLVDTILEKCPIAGRLLLHDTDAPETGDVALHVAARKGNMLALRSIINADRDCAMIRNEVGHVALHCAVEMGHFAAAQFICAKVPESAQVQCEEGCLPLHEAVSSAAHHDDAPQITAMLLGAFPGAVTVTTDEGLLPMHLASMSGFPAGIRTLFAHDFDTVQARENTEQMLPLDFAVDGYSSAQGEAGGANSQQEGHEEILAVAVQHMPDASRAAEMMDRFQSCVEILLMSTLYKRPILMPRNGSTPFLPIHGAAAARPLQRSWKTLLSIFGEDHMCDIDENGLTALHVLASSDLSDINTAQEMVCDLYGVFPDAGTHVDNEGLLPLHRAVMNSAPYEIINSLLDCDGSTIAVEVGEQSSNEHLRGLLPFQVGAVGDSDITVIYLLLRGNPVGVGSGLRDFTGN